ncbi:MAG: rod shape-determining protein MreD [Gammaproteobacteria bacterium]|nr:rod shape-determining protein MreD [Gammaproteobacteria bacterium]
MARSVKLWPAIASLLVALMLEVLPLPEMLNIWRPPFLTLVLIYWCMMWPSKIGIITAFFSGLALDILCGSLLGENALALSLVAFLTSRFYLQIRIFPLLQLSASVFALLTISSFVSFWIDGIAGLPSTGYSRAFPVITGTLLWPFVMGLMDRLRYIAENRKSSLF